jgi:hypothetical protein
MPLPMVLRRPDGAGFIAGNSAGLREGNRTGPPIPLELSRHAIKTF